MTTEPAGRAPDPLTCRSLRGGAGRTWLGLFVALFAAVAAWSLASPLFSGPDEPAHVLRAASVARGELLGRPTGGPGSPRTIVTVPAWLSGATEIPRCFAGRPAVSAGCAPSLSAGGGRAPASTYVGRYPPLYYAVVGWPTLVASGRVALYLMRLSAAALCSAFLAGALWCALRSRHGRGLLIGLALAITPQALFLSSVVNPSGLEICTAICVWTAGLVLVEQLGSRDGPDSVVVAWLVTAVSVLSNVRSLSPFFGGLAAVTLVALAGWPRFARLLRARAGRIGVATGVLAAGAGAAWIVAAGALHARPTRQAPLESGILHQLTAVTANTFALAPQYLGVFGWLDTYLPPPAYALALATAVAALVVGLRSADRRHRAVTAALAVACLAVPIAVILPQESHLGVFGQARDWMPLWVGLPLVACSAMGAPRDDRSAGAGPCLVVTGVVAVALQVLAWAWALDRYEVGLGHGHPRVPTWGPPLPTPVLALGLVVSLVWLAWWSRRHCGAVHLGRAGTEPPRPSPTAAPVAVAADAAGHAPGGRQRPRSGAQESPAVLTPRPGLGAQPRRGPASR